MKIIKFIFNKYLSITAISLLFFVIGCSDQQKQAGGFKMPPMPVEVAKSESKTIEDNFDAIGNIEANEAITVVSEIDAVIISLPFEEGSFIKKGALIAQLDDSQLAAEVSRTEALYSQSKTSYNRIKEIVDQKAGTPQDLDDASAALKVAEANLALAKARLSKTKIVAPFDGIIGARKVSVGTFLRSGQPITELANIKEIRVTFFAPERYVAQIHKNAEVSISTTAYTDHEVKGKIIVIEPVLDPETRSVRVIARVPNPDQKFLPGMSANVSAVLTQHSNAIVIPTEAIFANGDQSFVFQVKADSTVSRVPVKLGLQLTDVVEIKDGLNKDALVVRAGHQKLFEGAKVIPISSKDNMDNTNSASFK